MLSVLIRQLYSDFGAHKAHTFCFCSANLALKKPTAQSSTYNLAAKSKNAVDGVRNTDWNDDIGWCTHTNLSNPAWWRVDLGSNHVPISDVFIINVLTGYFYRSEDYKITLGKYDKRSGLKVKYRLKVFAWESNQLSRVTVKNNLTSDKPVTLVPLNFYVEVVFENVGF